MPKGHLYFQQKQQKPKNNNTMKKSKILAIGILAIVSFLALAAFLVLPVAGVIAATGVAVSGVVTESNVREVAPTLDMEDISKTVTEMLPSRTPIDTILRRLERTQKAEAMEHRYYEVGTLEVEDNLDTDATGTGASEAQATSAYTYSSGVGLPTIYVQVLNEGAWSVNDTLLMRNLTLPVDATGVARLGGSATTVKRDVMFLVIAKSGSVLRLQPRGGVLGPTGESTASTFVSPNFANTVKLYRMGRAHYETDAQTTPMAMLPEPITQYGQFFMSMIQESTFQKMTKKEVDWRFSDYERLNLLDMKRGMEKSFLWGDGGFLVNPANTSQKIYTTHGITKRIDNALTYGTGGSNRTISFDNVVNWAKGVFVGNSGSDSRYLFGGADLIKQLHSVETIQKQVNGKSPVVNWGLKFTEVVTNFGILYIYHHPIFDETGWGENGLIVDFEHISKHDFLPMKVYDLDLKKSGVSNSDARVISEASFLTLAYPACHAIIRPAS